MRGHEKNATHVCQHCKKTFTRKDNRNAHERICGGRGGGVSLRPRRKRPVAENTTFKIVKTRTAFSNANVTWKLRYPRNDGVDYIELLNSSTAAMRKTLERYQQLRRALKFNMSLHVQFEQATDPSIKTLPPVVLVTDQYEFYADTNIETILKTCAQQLQNNVENYEGLGSGWVLSSLIALDTTAWQLDPLRASTFHPLPDWVQNTLCVVNVKNTDNKCFKYAVLAGLYEPTDPRIPHRVSSYTPHEAREDAPDFTMLTFPVTIKDITKFEKTNGISVNVYSIDEKKDSKTESPVDSTETPTVTCRKRKSSQKPNSRAKKRQRHANTFLDDEADADDTESDDEEDRYDDVDDTGNVENLINDNTSSDEEEEEGMDISMYHTLQQRENADVMSRIAQRFRSVDEDGNDVSDDDEEGDVRSDEEESEQPKTNDKSRGIVFPLRVTNEELTRHVNLLLTEREGTLHYSTIKNFSGFIRAQYSKHSGGRTFYCYSCLHGFTAKPGETTRDQCELLKQHVKYCKKLNPQRVSYPESGEKLNFTRVEKQLKHPFIGYADFESVLEKDGEHTDLSTGVIEAQPTPLVLTEKGVKAWNKEQKEQRKEFRYQKHRAASYFTKFVSIDGVDYTLSEVEDFPQADTYVGYDAVEVFLDYVQRVANETYKKYIKTPREIDMSDEDEQHFRSATHCHICEKELSRDNDVIVRDHCHITSRYRGAAHQACNLNYKIDPKRWKMPIVFHNLRGYDGHLLIQAAKPRHGPIRVIPNNMERYTTFSIGRVQFIDSFQFTMQSLDSLVKTLSCEDFKFTREHFCDEEEFTLVRRKGVFPYDFFDDTSKMQCTELPPREAFFSRLSDEECSVEDYIHAKNVWNTFGCRSFRDYHDIYLVSDVVLLADFFEKFRDLCLRSYGLDPAHYFTAPGMAWDAALRMTGIELDLLDNEEMYTFFERSIRGGISQISKRFARANNEQCGDAYDPLKPITHLIYLDANNLYGWAMSQPLPTGKFRWLTREEIDCMDFTNLPHDAKRGYVLEVRLEYPEHLHDAHSDYPLAPEHLVIQPDMLSPFQTENFPEGQKKPTKKLSPNLYDKEHYVVHYRNLQFYLEQGLRVKHVHRVLEFEQSAWLAPYINFNTTQRALATSDFEKDLYKLMVNAVFGKTQENLRNRINLEVVTSRKRALKIVSKPTFKRSVEVREDMTLMQSLITNMCLNKPLYVGFSVLDLSKLHMYRFHYENMKQRYCNINLCFTDTDSLLYEITTPDIFSDMLNDVENYDFSDYSPSHRVFTGLDDAQTTDIRFRNKKVLGKFKDELKGLTLLEIAALRPKCYSLKFLTLDDGEREKKTAKAVKKSVKKSALRHDMYRETVKNLSTIQVRQNVIKSKAHQLGTYHQCKTALTAFDTKRWILPNGIDTRAFGHIDNTN